MEHDAEPRARCFSELDKEPIDFGPIKIIGFFRTSPSHANDGDDAKFGADDRAQDVRFGDIWRSRVLEKRFRTDGEILKFRRKKR